MNRKQTEKKDEQEGQEWQKITEHKRKQNKHTCKSE